MTVGLAGAGSAIEAVEAVLGDEGVPSEAIEPGEAGNGDLAVIIDQVGSPAFEAANEAALSSGETEWVSVELGGIGGYGLGDVDAAICGFGPDTACFECLTARVTANIDRTERSDTGVDESRDGSVASHAVDSVTARLAGTVAGAKILRTLAKAPIGGLVELPYVERKVFAVPDCRCGGAEEERENRFGGLDRRHEKRSLDDAIARAERTLDPRVGIVNSVGEAASFPVPYYLAGLSDTTPFSDAQATPQAAGVATNWDAAFMKGIGETLERYCAGVYRTDDLPSGASNDLDRTVSPAEFVRPGDQSAAASVEEPIRWVPGEALTTAARRLLPAAFVCFPPPEERFRPAITTGLGLGSSGTDALLSGLYEVIERDATMLGWYSTFEPLGLRVESERFETLRRRARAEDLSTTALLVSQDVDVPVVAATVHHDEEWPRFAAGSDADLDATRAAESALAEALQNWTELRGMGREDGDEAAGAIGHYAEFPPAAESLIDVDRAIPAASVGTDASGTDELEIVLERLAAADLNAYGARLTTRDVKQVGFEVVRVLVPAAQPLFTGEPYFGKRARSVPESLGFEARLDREHHPYP